MTTAHALRARRARLPAAVRWVLAAAAALVVGATAPTPASAQMLERTVRFQVAAVGDSTFTFTPGQLRWVKTGTRGMVVDPRRRDALVARFQVLGVNGGVATALVTGQTTALTQDHVAVLEVPMRPWYASSLFWAGAILGLLGGAAIGSM